MNDHNDINLSDTAAIIEAFGGIRPMAHKLDVPVSTVQGWKQRDTIPENRAGDVLAAAEAHEVDLSGIGSDSGNDDPVISEDVEPADAPPLAPEPLVIKSGAAGLKNGGGAFAIAVVALIVAVGVGGWMALGGGGSDDNVGSTEALERITDRLATLEETAKEGGNGSSLQQFAADFAELRTAVERISETRGDDTALSAKVEELDIRLKDTEAELDQMQIQADGDALSAAAAMAAAQDEIGQLRQQLAALGESGRGSGEGVTQAVGLALAAGRLQRTLDQGAPYQDAMANLRALSEGDATLGAILDRLAGQAGAGILTREALTQSFNAVARDVVAAAGGEAAGGWTDRALQRIQSVASVRRVGPDVTGDGPEARVARAEFKLRSGDMAGAVGELDDLTGAAAAAAEAWLTSARARLDADVAVGEIEALAIARLQSGNGGS
ncbi:MAG: hypothetical protein GKS02_01725 [Alphaproteobacteria bacterium]|nr:hypothetical protein [Alphaproteobacteria bacterium]